MFPLSKCRSQKGRSESDFGGAAANFSATSIGGSLGSTEADALPDRHRSLQMPLAPLPVIKKLSSTAKKTHLLMSDEVHDYSEIYTPSAEEAAGGLGLGSSASISAEDSSRSFGARTGSGDSGLTGLSGISGVTPVGGRGSIVSQPPPPPPLHRYPSWENRIYQVASEGMRDVQIDSKNNNNGLAEDSRSSFRDLGGLGGFGSDINVPVYATVKGVSKNKCIKVIYYDMIRYDVV